MSIWYYALHCRTRKALANTQTCRSLRSWHIQSMDVDKVLGRKLGLAGYVIRGMEMKIYTHVIVTKSHLMAYLLPVKELL